MNKIGDRIYALRKSLGKTQEEFIDRLRDYGIKTDKTTFDSWENNQQYPSLGQVKAMAQIFGISTDYLIDGVYKISDSEAEIFRIPVYSNLGNLLPSSGKTKSARVLDWEAYTPFPHASHISKYLAFILSDQEDYSPPFAKGDTIIVFLQEDVKIGDYVLALHEDKILIRKLDSDSDFSEKNKALKILGRVLEIRKKFPS